MKCAATVILLDDRWGALVISCKLELGHEGSHQHPMGATVPPAVITWN